MTVTERTAAIRQPKRVIVLSALLAIGLAGPAVIGRGAQSTQAPQSPQGVQQAPVAPRRAKTVVMAASGDRRPARGLACESFAVFVAATRVRTLGCTSNGPITLAILVDATKSVSYFKDIESAIRDVASRLRPEDKASVAWFGRELVPGEPFGRDPAVFDRAGKAIWKAKQGHTGNSPLWDALNATLTRVAGEPGFRAVLVITDGRATGNLVPFGIVLQHAVNAAIPVSFLMPNMPSRPGFSPLNAPMRPAWDRPVQVARTTGGLTGAIGGISGSMRDQLRRMIEFHQNAYEIAFETTLPPDGPPAPLEVRIGRAGLALAAPQVTTGR